MEAHTIVTPTNKIKITPQLKGILQKRKIYVILIRKQKKKTSRIRKYVPDFIVLIVECIVSIFK